MEARPVILVLNITEAEFMAINHALAEMVFLETQTNFRCPYESSYDKVRYSLWKQIMEKGYPLNLESHDTLVNPIG